MKSFLDDLLAAYGDGCSCRVHFPTAREAANIALAAVDGHARNPGKHRNYCYLPVATTRVRPGPDPSLSPEGRGRGEGQRAG